MRKERRETERGKKEEKGMEEGMRKEGREGG